MIYLDHNATTPMLQEVLEAMLPYFVEKWGNPSSSYRFGASLKRDVMEARSHVAALVGAKPQEIIFTSGATESNNAALYAALSAAPEKRHVITTKIEHSSVIQFCRRLEMQGYSVTYLPVDKEGILDVESLEEIITENTAVVSVMWANNETGVLCPIHDVVRICNARAIPVHCDAVQAVGRLPVDVCKVPVDYLTMSGHKIGGPKGIGALYIRKGASASPFVIGGHQERGLRGGTENMPLIAGFGKAAKLSLDRRPEYDSVVRPLRDALENHILTTLPNAELNGHRVQRIANTTNITFNGIDAEALLLLLDQAGICASAGSACLADSDQPSHVLQAMKPSIEERQAIRFSLGTNNTEDEIMFVAIRVCELCETLGCM